MKLTRILVVVVAMHLALAALVFCFSGCRTRGLEVIDTPTTPQMGHRVPPDAPTTSVPPVVTRSTVRPTPTIRREDVRVPPTTTRRTTTRRPSTQPGAGEQSYEVQSGDTIWSISQRFGLSMRDLLSRNGLAEDDIIRVGQKIVLPAGAREAPAPRPTPTPVTPPVTAGTAPTTSATTTPPTGAAAIAPGGVYVVQPNDNLWTIARRHGTTIDAIRQANGLTTDLLQPGQELKIPGAAPTPAPAGPGVVEPAPASAEPAGAVAPPSAAAPAGTAPTGATENTYLEPGETLADVARKYNTTVEELLRLNGLQDAGELKEFDAIRVPVR